MASEVLAGNEANRVRGEERKTKDRKYMYTGPDPSTPSTVNTRDLI